MTLYVPIRQIAVLTKYKC